MWPDKPPNTFPDAREHAMLILEAVHGDYRLALEHLPAFHDEFGLNYCRRLEWLLSPKGEA